MKINTPVPMTGMIAVIFEAAIAAGKKILKIYDGDIEVAFKADDSPLTLADKRAHAVITEHLQSHKNTEMPILSEEGRTIPYRTRKEWTRFWLVDPLDGTKEFIKRNGEFTVNIALIDNGRPIMGVVYVPVKDKLFFGAEALGAFAWSQATMTLAGDLKILAASPAKLNAILGKAIRLPVRRDEERPFTVVGSRSHATEALEQYVDGLKRRYGEISYLPAGSSLKICLVAEGDADIYPRLGPTMEWDTAAGHAVAAAAGATVQVHKSSTPLSYNKENLLNPWFIVKGPHVDPIEKE